jgi:hypothetical protein
MPITSFLGDQPVDPETKRIMGVAYEMVHAALARDWGNAADQIIAMKVIELAKAGEPNPDRICEQVLVLLRGKR